MSISSYINDMKLADKNWETQIFRILSNSARFKILKFLICNPKKDVCVKEIAQDIKASQSATSHQLALLEASDLIRGERMGQNVCYFLTGSPLVKVISRIIKVIC
jgi:DNA-binding transcriptional ArsR family regulator